MPPTVLLGILDERIEMYQTCFYTNKIGGQPDWIIAEPYPSCTECHNQMVLVVQLYCPLEGSVYHRTLYVFTCVSCKNNRWTVVRQQDYDISAVKKLKDEEKRSSSAGDNKWGVDTDDWGTEANDWGEIEDGNHSCQNDEKKISEEDNYDDSSQEQTLSSQNENYVDEEKSSAVKPELKCRLKTASEENLLSDLSGMDIDDSDGIPETQISNVILDDIEIDEARAHNVMSVLQSADSHVTCSSSEQYLLSYFISVVEEPSEDTQTSETEHIKKLLKDYEREQGVIDDQMTSSGSNSSSEKYEKTSHADKYFHKFAKRIARCREQVIRYEWNGNPLYISKPEPDLLSQRVCPHCQSTLVFELQIMPELIDSFSFKEVKDTGIEYGTILIYTCKSSCWTDESQHRVEYVFVQPDPDQHLFNAANKVHKK